MNSNMRNLLFRNTNKKGKIFPVETHKKHNMCFLPVSEKKKLKETKNISVGKI